MMRQRLRPVYSVLSALIVAATLGCAHTIDVTPSSTANQGSASQSIAENDRVPFVIEAFRMSQNGSPQNPSSEIERRILNSLRETRLFSTLVPLSGQYDGDGGKMVTARLAIDETIDSHPGATAFKGIVIGASMFLLSPFIDLDYDYAAQASLEIARWDGRVTRYEARSSGTAHYNLFRTNPAIIAELKGRVSEACLQELMTQLVHDTNLYLASQTPLPASTIRTVTVNARRSGTAQGVPPAVPVSESPAP
ncbi:MAG: hypothetical protein FJ247_08110 [Nitrospira sp.]|nr:hypothetical protein [Nitrospira sp.]